MLEPRQDGWRKLPLGEVASFVNGYPFRPSDWSEHGTPIVRIAQMTGSLDGCDRYLGVIPEQFVIGNGDLLFSWSATLSTQIWNRGVAFLNQHIFKVVPRAGNDLAFLHHLLDYRLLHLAGQSHGTTMRHITRADLLPHEVNVPLVLEQRQIGSILDTIDEAIRKTEQIIAKLGQVKQGLLHDLLTRGIDDNGELRDPTRHPEHFTDSSLGRMPRRWVLSRLAEIADVRTGIAKNSNRVTRDASSVHYLRVANVQDGFLDLSDMAMIDVSKTDVDRYRVLPGDVLMNEGGDLDKLGRGAIWRGEYDPCVHQNHVFAVRCGPLVLSPFLNIWTGSAPARRYFMVAGKQTTNLASINKTALGRMPTLVPPLAEQRAIVAVMEMHEHRASVEEANASKLRLLKQGLMEDLLTGRVRVTPLLEGAPA